MTMPKVFVMPGLVPGIYAFKTWMAVTSTAMTTICVWRSLTDGFKPAAESFSP
jgi:hypothetical protein